LEPTLFKNMINTLGTYRPRYLKGFVLLVIANLLTITNPLIFRKAVMAMEVPGSTLAPWVIALVAVAIMASSMKFLMRLTFIIISRDIERDVRLKLFVKMQKQSAAFYDKFGIGELLSRLTNDITAYRAVLGPGVMYPLFFLTLAVPGLIALFFISPILASFALIPLFIIPIVNGSARTFIYEYSMIVQEGLGKMSTMAQEYYSGIRAVKTYVIESSAYRRFQNLCKKLVGVQFRLLSIQGVIYPFFSLMTKLTTVGLVLLSGYIIYRAWGELSTADFVSFMWIQSYIFQPILMLGWLLPIYEKGRAAYDRLVDIYNEPIQVLDRPDASLVIPENADIHIRNLTFTYPTVSRPTLRDINLHIPAGTIVGITGPVGSGKTTLLRLLNREYEIPDGKISFSGHDIHEYHLDAFSNAMVTVEQIPFLFSKTIGENIRFGKAEATQEEVELVADYADLHQTVLDFPEQYETLVGERGVTLSGGQKQRVAMARAFLVERSILLLDDIFSAVDTATERRIFSKLQNNFKGKTVLLITHRVSILDQLQRVVYMQDGRIVEDGSPAELKQKKGRYAALAELQMMS